jgi:hypothetical protein
VLKSPALPSVVADRVLEIAISGTWQLRHPVGPDAVPFLTWRKAMTDEEWVVLGIARRRCLVRPSQGRVRDRCPSAGLTMPALTSNLRMQPTRRESLGGVRLIRHR